MTTHSKGEHLEAQELRYLKAVIEGKRDLPRWKDWLDEHGSALEAKLSRGQVLRLRYHPTEEIPQILRDHGIDFERSDAYEWLDVDSESQRCRECGAPLQYEYLLTEIWTSCPNGCFEMVAVTCSP